MTFEFKNLTTVISCFGIKKKRCKKKLFFAFFYILNFYDTETRSMNESALDKTLFYIFTFLQFKKWTRKKKLREIFFIISIQFNFFNVKFRNKKKKKNLIRLLNLFVVFFSESRANSQSLIVHFILFFNFISIKFFKKFGSFCKKEF